MKNIPLYLFLSFVLIQHGAKACQCPPTTLSLDECAKYELIFRGKIISLRNCDNNLGEAVFEVIDLYKGNIKVKFPILFDCKKECAQEMRPGDEWIIYTNYKQITNGMLDWCSRSRRYFAVEKQDFYAVNYGNDYDDEAKFLSEKLGRHRPLSEKVQQTPHQNEKPSLTQTIIILIVSLVCMVMFYWFFGRIFKKL